MASLIDTIPVYKPQVATPGTNQGSYNPIQTNKVIDGIINKYPQDRIYTYIPATPITQAKTRPVGITAQPASGELIKENIFQSIGNTIKSYADYTKYFYKAAFKGEGTDYSVGKVNDLAIRAGSLGIATVLATTKLFPFAKGMEFVGLSTWFASMALWPKILGAPIKALYGVDINQKYKDSQGRRKDVYEDNQYRPMDIFRYADVNGKPLTKEEYYKKYDKDYAYLDKIADKRNIPRNIKNRHEATMNEMGQIAVQGRTLSMATAGIMTPVLSSLAADAVQKPLKNFMSEQRYNKQLKNIEALTAQIEKLLGVNSGVKTTNIDELYRNLGFEISPKLQATFASLLPENGEMTKAEFSKLERFIEEQFFGTGMHTSIKAAMSKDSRMSEPFIRINEQLKSDLTKISKDAFKEVLETIPENKRSLIPQEFWNYEGISANNIEDLLRKLHIENGQSVGQHKTNALFSSFAPEVIEPFAKFQTTKNPNYQKELEIIENEYKVAKETAERLYREALESAVKRAEETARRAGKNENEIAQAIWEAKSAVKRPKIRKRVISEEVTNSEITSLIQKLRNSINEKFKAYLGTNERYIISKEKITNLFKFAELNEKLKAQIALFEKATIKNIAESSTAISWENIPQEYLTALNFNKNELTILASADATTASKIVTKRMEEIVKNPEQYKKVIETMSELAKKAIAKDERALIKLIGTVEKPGLLFKVKELMETVAEKNFGIFMKDAVEVHYYGNVAAAQRKLRNTTDSLVRPIKALDLFKHIDSVVEYIIGTKDVFDIRQTKPEYYMFHGMEYDDAIKAFKAYIKDIVLQKNDINSWTTKMEVELPGAKKGLKYSKAVLCSLADMINGDLHDDTIRIIEGADPQNLLKNKEFIEKLLNNNKIMRARFLSLHNPLLKFMTENTSFGKLIEELKDPRTKDNSVKILKELLQDKIADLGTLTKANNYRLTYGDLKEYFNILDDFAKGTAFNPGYKLQENINKLKGLGAFSFNTSNKAVSEMSGKNITDFFASAAQNIRARNKWAKLIYGLLGGTLAVSAIAILCMGKKNNLNPHIYEKKEIPQGVNK